MLVSNCDEKLIEDVKNAVDNFFSGFFANKKNFTPQEIFYLNLWAKFIIRFVDDENKILEMYREKFEKLIAALTANANFNAADLQKKALTLSKKILGEEHPNTITAMINLAIYLHNIGLDEESNELQEKITILNERKKINRTFDRQKKLFIPF